MGASIEQMRVNLHHAVNDMAGVNVGEGRFGARRVALGEAQPPRAPDAPKGFLGWVKHYAARAVNAVFGWTGFRAASRQEIAHERIDAQVRAGIAALTREPPDLATARAKLDMDSLGKLLTADMHGDAVLQHLYQQMSDMKTAQLGKLGEALAQAGQGAEGAEPTRSPLKLLEQMRQKVLAHDLIDTLDKPNQSLQDKRRECGALMNALGKAGWETLNPQIKKALGEQLALVGHDGQTQVTAPPPSHIHNPSAERSRLLNTLVDTDASPARKLELLSQIAPSLVQWTPGSPESDILSGQIGAMANGQLQVLAQALDNADIRGLHGEMVRVLDGGLKGAIGGNLIHTLSTIDRLRAEVKNECDRRGLAHPLGEALKLESSPEVANKYASPINRMVETLIAGQAYHDRAGHAEIPRQATSDWLSRLGLNDADTARLRHTQPSMIIPSSTIRNEQIGRPGSTGVGVCQQFWTEIGSYPITLNGQSLVDPEAFKTLGSNEKDPQDPHRMEVVRRLKAFVDATPGLAPEQRAEKLFQLSQLLTQGVAKGQSLTHIHDRPAAVGLPCADEKGAAERAKMVDHRTKDRFVVEHGANGTIQIRAENRFPLASLRVPPSGDSDAPRTIQVDPLQSHFTIHTDITLPSASGPPTLDRLDVDWQLNQRPLT